jgi:uncharacterized protein YqeY
MNRTKGLLLMFLFVSFLGKGQDTFLGELDFKTTSRPSIAPLSDGGWYLYAADETKLVRQNECGEIIWTRDFDIANDNCCIGDAIAVSENDDVTILTREFDSTLNGYRITQISSSGIINWSKVYRKAGRKELLESETREIEVINVFLPKQLSEEETKKICQETVKNVGATSMKDMGKVMGALKSKHADTIDFSKVSSIIKELLN